MAAHDDHGSANRAFRDLPDCTAAMLSGVGKLGRDSSGETAKITCHGFGTRSCRAFYSQGRGHQSRPRDHRAIRRVEIRRIHVTFSMCMIEDDTGEGRTSVGTEN